MLRSAWKPCSALASLALCGVACVGPEVDQCELAQTERAIEAPGRYLLGAAAPFAADHTLRAREDELAQSMAARRQAAWRAVEAALAPVALAQPVGASAATVPTWQTWYGRDDLARLFHAGFAALPASRQRAHAPFTDDELDATFAGHADLVLAYASWPRERLDAYAASLSSQDAIAGLAGVAPVAHSPAATRHLLASYPQAVACQTATPPAAYADGPGPGDAQMTRETLALPACGLAQRGPYFVDATATAVAEVDVGTVRLRDATGQIVCEADAGTPCLAAGPATLTAELTAPDDGAPMTFAITYRAADPAWSACLAGGFPHDAAIAKASWRRIDPTVRFPRFDTSAAAMSQRLASAAPSWQTDDGAVEPADSQIYLARDGDRRFRLAGLHLMTKELDHWLWITLWWSDTPNDDFGADRPASLTGVWANYKMCVVSTFDEAAAPHADLAAWPSLQAAVMATGGDASWCSNPYLEDGAGNARTNCVGCHQHASAGVAQTTILNDSVAFPAHGVDLTRNNFPADYAWSVEVGDRLGAMFADEVRYWTTP